MTKTNTLIETLLLMAFLLFVSPAVLTQTRGAERSPEEVMRALVRAMYANDVATYERLTIPDPRRALLVRGGSLNESAVKEIDEDPFSIQIKIKREFRYQGKPVERGSAGDYPVGTTVVYMVAHRGGPMMAVLVRRPEGWRVDLRWWLSMVELSSGKEPQAGTAQYAVRALLASMLQLNRGQAQRFIMPDGKLEILFAGAPSQREPSGHLDALVGEMPLVEVLPGEFFEMPSRRIVEGVQREGVKVLVGLYGSVEIPFVVHKVGSEWKVEVEPYFFSLMR
jgi:hypothetical protein